MITLAKIASSIINSGKRIFKVREYGVKTAFESMPFGEDSNPLKDMTALYVQTGANNEQFIIGYINTKQLAEVGEKRLFSLKTDGTDSAFIWLKNNETIELNGNTDNLVRFAKLELALQQLDQAINGELVKIQTGITGVGGAYVPAVIQTDISQSKINDLKCS